MYSCTFYHFGSQVLLIGRIISIRCKILLEITLVKLTWQQLLFFELFVISDPESLKSWCSHLQSTNSLQLNTDKEGRNLPSLLASFASSSIQKCGCGERKGRRSNYINDYGEFLLEKRKRGVVHWDNKSNSSRF